MKKDIDGTKNAKMPSCHCNTPSILARPQFNHPFIVATDASGTAIGAVLSQDVEGEEKIYCLLESRNYRKVPRISSSLPPPPPTIKNGSYLNVRIFVIANASAYLFS